MLTYCLKNNFVVHQADVESAFLQASLDEEIYMTLPDGFKDVYGVQKALKLKKSIYGLKQSSREFHKKLANILITLGSSSVESYKNLITNINKHENYRSWGMSDII